MQLVDLCQLCPSIIRNHLWVGVNGKWIELSGPNGHYGLNDVDDGEVIRFPAGSKSVTVTVPESGRLKIMTSGWESDPIDDCFGKSITRALYDYCLAPKSDNDNIGLIQNYYEKSNNFGIGPYAVDSIRNPRDGDPDANGDFNLRYRIEQLMVYPPTTQPPAAPKLPTAPTQPPTTRPPPPPPEQQLPPICKIRPWLPQCKDLM